MWDSHYKSCRRLFSATKGFSHYIVKWQKRLIKEYVVWSYFSRRKKYICTGKKIRRKEIKLLQETGIVHAITGLFVFFLYVHILNNYHIYNKKRELCLNKEKLKELRVVSSEKSKLRWNVHKGLLLHENYKQVF